jgi:acyl carrier protein
MNFSQEAAEQRIKSILVEDLFVAEDVSEISSNAGLADELGLDSVGFMELSTLLTEAYGVAILDTDMTGGSFATVASIVAFLEGKLREAA